MSSHKPSRDDLIISAVDVRAALEHLYANVELAQTPLAHSGWVVEAGATVLQRAQAVRSLLLDAIEALRPVRPLQAQQQGSGRSYEVLSLRYVSCLSIDEIAERLAVGSRQVYRDLRRAEEELAALLPGQRRPAPLPSAATAFQAELAALARPQDQMDLCTLLESALGTVRALAQHKGVELHFVPPTAPVTVTVTPGIAQEMLIQILSALIQQCTAGHVLVVRCRRAGEVAEVRIGEVGAALAWDNPLLQNALLMAQMLEMGASLQPKTNGLERELVLPFAVAALRTLLVVEDNPGVTELYQRYLQGSGWRAAIVTQPGETVQAARELQPDAILLDVLMPEVDGWTLLQALRATPDLARIPVMICSVINDPELAQALGASAALPKPLSRLELLDALARVSRGYSAGAPGAASAPPSPAPHLR